MHLSSPEIALVASAITAAGGWLIAATTSHLNSRRDHTARLWEREAKVYEYMLSRVEYWAELRRDAMFAMNRNETDIAGPDPIELEEDHRLVEARLDLFGKQVVRDAFDRASMEGMQFIGAFSRYRTCELKNSTARSTLPEARDGLIAANKSATDSQKELVAVARKAVNRLPRFERDRRWKLWPQSSRDGNRETLEA